MGMAYEFKFPDVGEGIHEGVIIRWLVKEGDEVKEDQALVEMETAKAIVEIPSPKAGVVLKCNGVEGDTIKVGDILVSIQEKGADTPKMPTGAGVVGELPEAPPEGKETIKKVPHTTHEKIAPQKNPDSRALPAVRMLAEKLHVDLGKMIGTGGGGRITMEDVINAGGTVGKSTSGVSTKSTHTRTFSGPVEKIPVKGVRKIVAEHMAHSTATIPHVTHCDSCDVTELAKRREKEKGAAALQGVKLTYLPFIVQAVVKSLQEFPLINSDFDSGGGIIILKKYYNIGIAVDTEEGLMVPVIKNADKKSLFEIAKEINDLAEKARARKIDLSDLQDGTFTITNVGSVGGEFFTPIINSGQGAILGIGAIKEEPAIHEGNVVPRKILHLCLSFDHRSMDGAVAARFLNRVMEYLVRFPEQLT